jgi:hypothetical protein
VEDVGAESVCEPPSNRDECKPERAAFGTEGYEFTVGSRQITFSDWRTKDDVRGEFIGFSLSFNGTPFEYAVKAGGEEYATSDTIWLNPHGTSGPEVSAISHIDFCPDGYLPPADGETECDGDESGDDSSGDDSCTNPDGCTDEDGDGVPDDDGDYGDDSGDDACTNPDGCTPGDGGAGGDGSDDSGPCVIDDDCGNAEFCAEDGSCLPRVL